MRKSPSGRAFERTRRSKNGHVGLIASITGYGCWQHNANYTRRFSRRLPPDLRFTRSTMHPDAGSTKRAYVDYATHTNGSDRVQFTNGRRGSAERLAQTDRCGHPSTFQGIQSVLRLPRKQSSCKQEKCPGSTRTATTPQESALGKGLSTCPLFKADSGSIRKRPTTRSLNDSAPRLATSEFDPRMTLFSA